ncbi:X-Pro dipeptidyl-peptidase, partial [Pseudarthrobacter sp. AG30]|uniref:CocE/NonD family hydrolase n=1 Tax=Pseudarthrobacter sp. AG30 TaxID=2249742 RepID=UPI000DCC6756
TAMISFCGCTRVLARNAGTSALNPAEESAALMQLGPALVDPMQLNHFTPVTEHPVIGKGRWFDDWLAHPDLDEYWKEQDWSDAIGRVTVPVLSTTGWYDLKVHEQVADFVRVRTKAGSSQAREESRLVIGPWDHINLTGQYPDRYFGPLAPADLSESHVSFYDQTVRGLRPDTPAPRVRIFVM